MKKGFTLIETIIAIFILTIGILGVLNAFPLAVQIERSARMATIASQLGQAKIEENLSKSYSKVLCSDDVCPDIEDYETIANFSNFKRETEITCLDGEDFSEVSCYPDPGLKQVKVTVYWKSALRTFPKKVEIITLIAKR
ncbi:MAG: type IV pilus modification PilV family protein [Candidatus Nealsonbacteria bacterium]